MVRNFSKVPISYLANPYTHSDPLVMAQRAEAVDRAAARLLKLGIMTYPPIALNCRWTNYEKDFPHTWSYWQNFDKNFLERCDGLIVLMLDGWDRSVGVKSEIEYAKELGMPIEYISYEDLMNGKIDKIVQMNEDLIVKLAKI